jgi:hypothetical protein
MTQKIRVADNKLGLLLRRERELDRRILEGTLDIDLVLSNLQKLIEGKPFNPKNLSIISSISLSDRIALGKYDSISDGINENNFPIIVGKDYEVKYKIFLFNGRFISSDGVIKKMKIEGYHAGNIAELLKLGEIKPELQMEFPIVALDSVCDYHDVPVLDYYVNTRRLILCSRRPDWPCTYRFLGVCQVK